MPTRRYGQHFLKDPRIISRIIEGAGLSKLDSVLEIGPGRGFLTRALSASVKKVLSVEIDRHLFAQLADARLPENVKLLRGDALDLDPAALSAELGPDYKLVSNLPYEITSKTLEKFLPLRARAGSLPRGREASLRGSLPRGREASLRGSLPPGREASLRGGPTSVTLMLQKEVGERIVAKAGDMNRLALFCGYYSEARLLFAVPRGAFSPPPLVTSCVVRFDIRPRPLLSEAEETLFFKLSTAAFASKRKQIKNSFGSLLGNDAALRMKSAGLSPEARPQEITLKQWVTLARSL